jgi:hypothetical protein
VGVVRLAGLAQVTALAVALAPVPPSPPPMTTGPHSLSNALEPGFHCVRTHWIRGFMTFQLARSLTLRISSPASPAGTGRDGWVDHWVPKSP